MKYTVNSDWIDFITIMTENFVMIIVFLVLSLDAFSMCCIRVLEFLMKSAAIWTGFLAAAAVLICMLSFLDLLHRFRVIMFS